MTIFFRYDFFVKFVSGLYGALQKPRLTANIIVPMEETDGPIKKYVIDKVVLLGIFALSLLLAYI